MRERSGDILGIEQLVDLERGVDALHDLGRSRCKTAAPGGIGRGFRSWFAR